jgi:hypothetical protein
VLSEHPSTVDKRLAAAAAVTVPADGARGRGGAVLLLAVLTAQIGWAALLAWFVVRLVA